MPAYTCSYIIGLDKRGYQANSFLISGHKHILWVYCGYSLEVPRRGASNEFPQHMFLSRNKKNIDTFWLKKVSYQELCIFVKPFILADEECAL